MDDNNDKCMLIWCEELGMGMLGGLPYLLMASLCRSPPNSKQVLQPHGQEHPKNPIGNTLDIETLEIGASGEF